ncbi:MAG TPA: DNA repair protein RecO [Candidatus Saccharimonadales bacterium]|nr:DNA repair protein RecO [Candidatus Saccharimonadales bacterium]
MNQCNSRGIIIKRTNYGEADRIITVLTPEFGKVVLIAKGVRKIKSKLAGGIELFSVSELTFIKGRGEVMTLISSRLVRHYENIVSDITRVQAGYEQIRLLDKVTEDNTEPEYFDLLNTSFACLDDKKVGIEFIMAWFRAQLLRLSGHMPNLRNDAEGSDLIEGRSYGFDFDAMSFSRQLPGEFSSNEIKALRLLFSSNDPIVMAKISGMQDSLPPAMPLISTMSRNYLNA